MKIGMTYDLRSDYLALGLDDEETAEFDRPDTLDFIQSALESNGHEVERIGSVRALARCLSDGARYDLVFNICEGVSGFGREAQVPALLDAFGIPYTFCDPLHACVTLHKGLTKHLLVAAGIRTAAFTVVERESDVAAVDLPLPVFVKPVAEGTSKGCDPGSIITRPVDLLPACRRLLRRYRQPVLVERYLEGREFTIGILGSGASARAVGALEVVLLDGAEPGVYSYQNKEYCEQLVDYRLAVDPLALEAADIGLAAWRAIGGRDAGRVDLRCDAQGRLHVLEINPIPGLHPEHSDLPMLCTRVGMSYERLIAEIVESAAERIQGSARELAA